MKILVTGAKGFIGKNLIAELRNQKAGEIFEFDAGNTPAELDSFTKECNLVYHLAGVNRPKEEKEFAEGNTGFTQLLLDCLKKHSNKSPIIFSSSTQAALDNPYGKSKLEAEKILIEYSKETGVQVSVFRLPNVFGKWCKPSYNSVVATFCHKIANGLPVTVNNSETLLQLVYIDDVVEAFICRGTPLVEPVHSIKLGELESLIISFRETREKRDLPDLSDPLTRKLYATYLSYLPVEQFGYELKMNIDTRGSFTEFLRTPDRGQVSVNISKPGIVKGNHWHHTKNEKFLVVSGTGVIRFRKVGTTEVSEYHVSGEKLTVIDIPPGYTHNIENTGQTDLVTVMWVSEAFDPGKPDTISEIV